MPCKEAIMSALGPNEPNIGARVFWLEQVSEAAKVLSRSQVPNQFSGNIGASKISFDSSFELPVVRAPAFNLAAPQRRSHLSSKTKAVLTGGLVSILSLTAITTIGQSTFADAWQWLALDRTFEFASRSTPLTPESFAKEAEPSSPQLVVEKARGAPGEPTPLGLRISGDAKGAIVHIKGLMPGMELSTWNAVNSDAWEISATDLGDTWVAPPEGYIGSADLIAELHLPDGKIADRQGIKLEWGPPISPERAPRQFQWEEIVAGPPIAREPTPSDQEEAGPRISPELTLRQYDREEPAPPISTVPAARQLDREEIAVLLKRGKDLIATGDLAAARLVLKRAADANDVEATLAVAATYDPYVLQELKVYSFEADAGMARAWYEKAKQLGSSVALRRLEMLASGAR
jgi:hypothetical protein